MHLNHLAGISRLGRWPERIKSQPSGDRWGTAFRRPLRAFGCLAAAAGIGWGLVGCHDSPPPTAPAKTSKLDQLLANPPQPSLDAPADSAAVLRDSAIRLRTMVDTGIDFVHQSGNSDERPFPAANGSGVGVLDFDLDGWPDVFFANGTRFPIDLRQSQSRDACFRNLGGFRFQSVAARAGIDFPGYSAGMAVGDFDHDGFPDLYVTCYGENRLYRNQGDGTFQEVGQVAGVADDHWGTSAVWFDFNQDGLLDLYVGNYAFWDLESNKFCRGTQPDVRIFCSPMSVDPAPDFLYLNRGDGTFADWTEPAGLARRKSRTQGVLAADFNNDGWTDLYLGNDMHANSLFINLGDQTFRDDTDRSGMGYSSSGDKQAGMGVAAADINHDQLLEVFVTNYARENNNLYQQIRADRYSDVSSVQGLASDSLPWVGWGTLFVDLNFDRWPDLIVTNGHTDDNLPNEPFAQPAFVWENVAGRFQKISPASGDYLAGRHVGRGLAAADLDNDGRPDLIFAHLGQAPALLRNETPSAGNWILWLEGQGANRDAVGARIVIESPLGQTTQHRVGGGSYLSQSEPLIYVPQSSGEVTATIYWGVDQSSKISLQALPLNRTLIVRQSDHSR
jgi:enediyne biosynthesis protein E4